jgi:hypothetical protein
MKLILGDNQFFGINHADLSKGSQTREQFDTEQKIKEFIVDSLKLGLDGFMINSNDVGFSVVNDFNFELHDAECHYSIPYPHKYAGIVNESGLMGLLPVVLRSLKVGNLAGGLKFIFSLNCIHLMPVVLSMEIPRNLPKGSVVYLQNVVTDLTLGLKNGDLLLGAFIKRIIKMGYKPGLISLNPGFLYSKLSNSFYDKELHICFNINALGFNVFPSKGEVENSIMLIRENTNWQLMGMSVFSSGAKGISAKASIDYVSALKLDRVVFGSSSLANIKSNIHLLK